MAVFSKHKLAEIILMLRPIKDTVLECGNGQRFNALFLDLLRSEDPGLSKYLHDMSGLKPYTVSQLMGPFTLSDKGAIRLQGEQEYRLRFTSYLPELSDVWLERLAPSLMEGKEVRIGDEILLVTGCRVKSVALEDLYAAHLLGDGSKARAIRLTFHTPTAFRSRGRNVIFPEAQYVWGNLHRRWRSVSRVDFGKDLHLRASDLAFPQRYRLETKILHFDGFRHVGFEGFCEYRLQGNDGHLRRSLSLLAEFSEFCGVGIKTTMGMGQVSCVLI
ncbi:MAG: CRISPR-associated endoribonuclease Cas6 [Candidatus Geothermincolales bacterium]